VRKINGAVGLQKVEVKPDLILSSPLRRAEETARLVADVLTPKAAVELHPPLAGGFSAEDVIKGLRAHRRATQILLVGHQPDLGHLASYLLTGSENLVPLPSRKPAWPPSRCRPSAALGRLTGWFLPRASCAIASSRN
jgi:phosphohistidine phosphatase SixA